MNTLTCTLHHPECVERDDPVTMLKKRAPFTIPSASNVTTRSRC
jgi:hypothetical protein